LQVWTGIFTIRNYVVKTVRSWAKILREVVAATNMKYPTEGIKLFEFPGARDDLSRATATSGGAAIPRTFFKSASIRSGPRLTVHP
jgi:hypothetical protein